MCAQRRVSATNNLPVRTLIASPDAAACSEDYLELSEKEYLIANCPQIEKEEQGQGQKNGCGRVKREIYRITTLMAQMLHSHSVWAIIQSHIFHNYCSYTVSLTQ